MSALRLLGLCLVLAGCDRREPPPAWRTDCPVVHPAPLSLDAAREAHRLAERRQTLRLQEAAMPGSFRREMHAALNPQQLAAGHMCLAEVADRGQLLFEHEYGFRDGLGGGGSATAPAGPFRRVHQGLFGGPETISCVSCHWVGGPDGAGAETDNAFLQGDGQRPGSGDARNPPALIGLGVVQALAQEMSRDLQQQRTTLLHDAAQAAADREVRLSSKGVDFGVLRVTAKGAVDPAGLRGVDADLVVKPFGWKGTLAAFSDFASEAFQVHMGMQSDALLAHGAPAQVGTGQDATDPDGDGVHGEFGRGPLVAMSVHLALLEIPIIEPLIQDQDFAPSAQALVAPMKTSFADAFQRGREQFHALGCASCHAPMLLLQNPQLDLDGVPPINLAHEIPSGLRYEPELHGYPVWLFSDLRRHDMGPSNLARHVQSGVAPAEYLTPRLWGVADSAPYLHDGRAPSFDYTIAGHDGEGAAARAAYAAIPWEEKAALRVYLMSLRRAPRLIVP